MENILDYNQNNAKKRLNQRSFRLLIISMILFLILVSCHVFRHIIIAYRGEIFNITIGVFSFIALSIIGLLGFIIAIRSLIKKEEKPMLSWVCLIGHFIFVGMFAFLVFSFAGEIRHLF